MDQKCWSLSQHWLWPYELDKLNNISNEFSATGTSESRLCPESDCRRGCGGMGILWLKSIRAKQVDNIFSDRVCAIRFPSMEESNSILTSIGTSESKCSSHNSLPKIKDDFPRLSTVEPPKKGHFGNGSFILSSEVVPISEVHHILILFSSLTCLNYFG